VAPTRMGPMLRGAWADSVYMLMIWGCTGVGC
jgi:hypothetical protein